MELVYKKNNQLMQKILIKICTRCLKKFECNWQHIQHCNCSKINLSESAKAYIQNNFSNCICLYCLQEIEKAHLLIREKKQ